MKSKVSTALAANGRILLNRTLGRARGIKKLVLALPLILIPIAADADTVTCPGCISGTAPYVNWSVDVRSNYTNYQMVSFDNFHSSVINGFTYPSGGDHHTIASVSENTVPAIVDAKALIDFCGGRCAEQYASANMFLEYGVQVLGPSDRTVRIDIQGRLLVTASGTAGSGTASFAVIDQSTGSALFNRNISATNLSKIVPLGPDDSFIMSGDRTLWVTMSVTSVVSGGLANIDSVIDPYFYIDPNDPNASLFSLQFDPSVLNIPDVSVPGPIVGAGLPGIAMASIFVFGSWWRRRRKVA